MKRKPVLCDSCGEPIARLADAAVVLRHDELGRAIEIALDHLQCVAARREYMEATGRDETLSATPAVEVRADRLKAIARAPWASASRVVGKIKALITRQTAPQKPGSAPDVRPRPERSAAT